MKFIKRCLFYFFFLSPFIFFICCEKETNKNNNSDEATRFILNPESIEFSYLRDTATIVFINTGSGEISWEVTFDTALFIMPVQNGILNPNASEELKIILNRSALVTDSTNQVFEFTINEDQLISVNCIVYNYSYEIFATDRNVINAAYIDESQDLYFLSSTPNSLTKFSTINKEFVSFVLEEEPIELSYSNEQGKLAILCINKLYLFNLESQLFEKSWDIPSNQEDVLFSNQGWIYVCPKNYGYGFKNINIETEEVIYSDFNFDGGTGYLHPSEKYIYLASNTSITKLDISSGIAEELYDKSFFGSYGRLWGNNNGTKMIVGNGDILNLSENEEEDLIEIGNLSNIWSITDMVHSSINQRIYVIGNLSQTGYEIKTQILYFEDQSFIYQDSIPAYYYTVPNSSGGLNFYLPDCKEIFIDSSNENIITITKCEEGAGLYHPFAIQIIKF